MIEGKNSQQQHLERLKVLCDLTRKLRGTMGATEVLDFIVDSAADLLDLPYTRAFILEGDILRLRAQHGGMLVDTKNVDFKIDERAGGIAVKSADIFYIRDVRDSPHWKNPKRQIEEGIGSYLAVPLINDESVIGILECLVMGVREFTANDLDLMSTFAAHAAIAIENVRLHEESQKSKQFFESIVRDNVDAIIISDLNTKIMFWNSGAERLYGFSEDEVIGKKLIELTVPQEYRDEVRQRRTNVAREKKPSTYETVRLKKDGEEVCVSIAL
jgi:PAS domain S-box-containing protein